MVSAATDLTAVVDIEDAHFDIEVVFRSNYVRIARLIARVVGDSARAEELAVEVFLKLWRSPKAQAGNYEAWLYRVALRKALDELRKRSRRHRYETLFGLLPASLPVTPEQLHSAVERQESVRRVLAALERRDAELLILRSHGSSYEEIAKIMALNGASVGTLLNRAQNAFRKEYEKRHGRQ
jgi:RNA polymerase sigma-70 factor (ECF subfamily)